MSEEITHQFPNNGFEKILARFDLIDTQLGSISTRMNSFEVRLVSLEEKVDRRLMETRPVWEQVLQKLDGVDTRLGSIGTRLIGVETRLEGVETKLGAVENRLGKVEHELYALGKKFRVFNQEILDVQNAQEDFEERVTKLERTETN